MQVYEGNENNCLIDNLNSNTKYEIRICSIINGLISPWTQIYKVKTLFDSIILEGTKKETEFLQKLKEWINYKKLELIYRGTRDGSTANIFHNKCDNQGPTLCLYKNNKGNIFGGFTPISWKSEKSGNYPYDKDSFLFTLTNIYGIEPTKFINTGNKSVYHYYNSGPSFGGGVDIIIYYDFINSNSNSTFPCSYQDILGKGKSIFTGDANNSNSDFKVEEIEVFKVYK